MPMRAVILTSTVLAGDAVGRHVCDLARTLITAGYQVEIWYEHRFTRDDPDMRSISIRAAEEQDLSGVDLVILEYAGWFPLAERIREASGTRLFWYHGVTPPSLWGSNSDRDLLEISIFKSRLVWACNLAVACSPFGANELAKHTGFPHSLIAVVPIGVNATEFNTPLAPEELAAWRDRLGLQAQRVVLYVGRLAGNKRIDLLVQALALLRGTSPQLHLLVVGDDHSAPAYREYAQSIRELAASLGLANQVTITGKVPDVGPYYQLADVFVLPSDHEGFGVPLVEAMAAGVPVIASDAGAMPWVLGAEQGNQMPAGAIFRAGSAEDLARTLSSVLNNPDYAQALRQRGRSRAREFGPDRFRQETINALRLATEEAVKHPLPPISEVEKLLAKQADVALRQYRVRSRVPVLGPVIQWLRTNLTSHVKEAYLDRIVERQVIFNLSLLSLVQDMRSQLDILGERIEGLEREMSTLKEKDAPDEIPK